MRHALPAAALPAEGVTHYLYEAQPLPRGLLSELLRTAALSCGKRQINHAQHRLAASRSFTSSAATTAATSAAAALHQRQLVRGDTPAKSARYLSDGVTRDGVTRDGRLTGSGGYLTSSGGKPSHPPRRGGAAPCRGVSGVSALAGRGQAARQLGTRRVLVAREEEAAAREVEAAARMLEDVARTARRSALAQRTATSASRGRSESDLRTFLHAVQLRREMLEVAQAEPPPPFPRRGTAHLPSSSL